MDDERFRSGFDRGMSAHSSSRNRARTLGEATTHIPVVKSRSLVPQSPAETARVPARLSQAEEALWSPRKKQPKRERHPVVALVAGGIVLLALVISLGWTLIGGAQQAHSGAAAGANAKTEQVNASGTPIATGHGPATGPWTTSMGAAIIYGYTPVSHGEPCTDSVMFLDHMDQWAVPPGCYGNVYAINPKNYPYAYGFGWCNWWVREHHLDHPDFTESSKYLRTSTPAPGAGIFFDGGVQGADPAGHWAQVVAVAPDHYWVLISEMNFAWRGAGWAKVDYRYIHVGPGVHFVYG